MELFGYEIYSDGLEKLKEKCPCVINTINPHSYVIAKTDLDFNLALQEGDVLLPDGIGIVMAAKWLKGKSIDKIAGSDVHQMLLENAHKKKQKVFYLGSSTSTLKKIEERVASEFPDVQIAAYSPPYKEAFTQEDNQLMIQEIVRFGPDVLFVGMTAPKQEKWVRQNRKAIEACTIVSIGAVFDFYAGTVKRSGKVWIDLGLEWLPRLIREPKRLWKRNFVSAPLFLMDVVKKKIENPLNNHKK